VSVFWAVIGLLVAWRITSWVGRRRDREQRIGGALSRHRPRRHHRPGDAKRRRIARGQARDLVAALGSARHDPIMHLAAGVVLEASEVAWQRSVACLAVWSTEAAWTTRSRVSWLGRQA